MMRDQQVYTMRRTLFLLFLSVSLFSLTRTVLADVPRELEPNYSEAILAYNSRNYDRALKLLDELHKKSPQTTEFLELKALALKSAKKTGESTTTYEALIKQKTAQGVDAEELAPYHFELGVARYRENKLKEAQEHLEFAARHDFNTGPTNFFLGVMNFKNGKLEEAGTNFREVTSTSISELQAPAYFYLGQVYYKTSQPGVAIQSFYSAKREADRILDDSASGDDLKKIASQIKAASEKAIEPLNKNQWFGNVSLATAYDNNISTLPESQTSGPSATTSSTLGKATLKEILQAGIGYMTSPTRAYQLVPSYRLSYNYNFNRLTRSSEYLSNIFSLYFTRTPLARTSYGLKAEGTYTFQNAVDPDTDKSKYTGFSIDTQFGPYIKHQLHPRWIVGGQVFAGPQIYLTDKTADSNSKQSGTKATAQAYIQHDRGSWFFNPTLTLSYQINETKGKDYKSSAPSASFSNIHYITDALRVSWSGTYTLTDYSKRTPKREDKNLILQASTTYKLTPRFTLIADASYTKNTSNLNVLYTYNRFVTSAGVSYSLF